MKLVKVKDFFIGKGQPLAVMCGPCVIESEEHAMETAAFLKELYGTLGLNLIYKSFCLCLFRTTVSIGSTCNHSMA